jgi:hypothetical protein
LFRYGPQRARRRRGEGMTFVTAIATAGNWMGDCRGSGGRSPPTCRARMREVHLREPPGTARACCAPSRRARFPPPSRPTPFTTLIRTTTGKPPAQWCEMEPSSIFSHPARGFRHRREVLAGSLGPPEGERSTGARNRNLQRLARLAPSLDRPAGSNCRAPDSSGYIGERRSRRQSEFSYFKNERTRAVSHLLVRPRCCRRHYLRVRGLF